MPNTLGHLAVQTVASRAVMPQSDLKWIAAGCVLPDVPWILQRALHPLLPVALHPDLRMYVTAQGSLVMCLVLAGAAAALSARPWRILALLVLSSIVHLLLDACQGFWAGGAHLLAPWSWEPTRWGLFRPESHLSTGLTLLGPMVLAYTWRQAPGLPVALRLRRDAPRMIAAILFAVWIVVPFSMIAGVEAGDPRRFDLLRAPGGRTGQEIVFSRAPYTVGSAGGSLLTVAGESLTVTGRVPDRAGHVSLRGRFADETTVEILEFHVHRARLREWASYVGLLLVAAVWAFDPAARTTGRDRPTLSART